jgi:hypothetical protein
MYKSPYVQLPSTFGGLCGLVRKATPPIPLVRREINRTFCYDRHRTLFDQPLEHRLTSARALRNDLVDCDHIVTASMPPAVATVDEQQFAALVALME